MATFVLTVGPAATRTSQGPGQGPGSLLPLQSSFYPCDPLVTLV
jgi:hypothetical protein